MHLQSITSLRQVGLLKEIDAAGLLFGWYSVAITAASIQWGEDIGQHKRTMVNIGGTAQDAKKIKKGVEWVDQGQPPLLADSSQSCVSDSDGKASRIHTTSSTCPWTRKTAPHFSWIGCHGLSLMSFRCDYSCSIIVIFNRILV